MSHAFLDLLILVAELNEVINVGSLVLRRVCEKLNYFSLNIFEHLCSKICYHYAIVMVYSSCKFLLKCTIHDYMFSLTL